MARVVIEKLNKFYQSSRKAEPVYAVHDLSLEVQDGEFLVLVGPSGCGKSTTLRLIAGLEEISSGTIRIGDQVVNKVEPKDRDIAMVFQNYALYPHMTVYENMAFGLELRKFSRPEIDRRVGSAAEMLGLEALLGRLPKELSGGQRQRVAVGRAIVRQPKVFLFDEPLSNLDAQMRMQMRAELARLHHQIKATMIYVTHDQAEAMTLGDRIVVMREGWLQQAADPATVYQHPANRFVAGFMGSPSMNFFTGQVWNVEGQIWFESGAVQAQGGVRVPISSRFSAGQAMVLGIRPEHLSIEVRPGWAPIEGRVELVEMMGAETLLHLRCGSERCVARLPLMAHFQLGATVRVHADLTQMRFFDAATGERISS